MILGDIEDREREKESNYLKINLLFYLWLKNVTHRNKAAIPPALSPNIHQGIIALGFGLSVTESKK